MSSNLSAALANTSYESNPSGQYTPEQFIQLAEQSGFQPAGAAVITAIGERESGLNDYAVNPNGGAAGTLQFLPAAWPQLTAGGAASCAEDAACALRAAFGISGGTNFQPWDATQSMEPPGQTAYGDWEDSQAQAFLANDVVPAIQALGQDSPAFRQQLQALSPRAGGSGGASVPNSGGGTFVGNTVNDALSGIGGSIISSLQSAYGQPFERAGIFLLGVVAVLGGLLLLSGGRGGTTVVNVGRKVAAA